jgi:hypothetical protein
MLNSTPLSRNYSERKCTGQVGDDKDSIDKSDNDLEEVINYRGQTSANTTEIIIHHLPGFLIAFGRANDGIIASRLDWRGSRGVSGKGGPEVCESCEKHHNDRVSKLGWVELMKADFVESQVLCCCGPRRSRELTVDED